MKTQTLAKAARTLLLGGAAAGALMAFAVPAQAATQSEKAEIAALKAQVDALTARLDAAEATQRATQDQAAQAQATAAQAQATAANADAQIQTLPTQVKTAVAALPPPPAPKPTWADNTTVSGRMYFDLTNVEQKSNGTKQAPSGTGFDIKRFYLGVDHKFNDVYSANLTLDFNYVGNDGETQAYIKKAYLQAKYSDALTVRLGSADLPWVPYAEDLYGYRYIENTLIDRDKFGTSADWGVHLLGKFGDSGLSYAVALVDGAGYKAPLRSKGMDLEGRLSYKVSDFNFAIGGYTGKLGKDNENTLPVVRHTANRFDAIAAYTTKTVRLGVEYFSAEDWNNVTTLASDKSDGYSLFGSYKWDEKWSVFGRYDDVTPKKDLSPNLGDKYFNIGVSYSPTKIVDLALVYKRDKIDNGTFSTSNGTIGGSNDGTYDELGLFGQLRW